MAETTKVIFAEDEVTIHLLMSLDPVPNAFGEDSYVTESKVLLPGESVELDRVPPYLVEKVKNGEAPGLTLVTRKRASEILKKSETLRAITEQTVDATGVVSDAENKKSRVKLASESISEETTEE
jgi:hypothetical protein